LFNALKRRLVATIALVLAFGAIVSAQTPTGDGGPDPAAVRVRIGPLWLTPTISIPNIGVDTNVFNDPPSVTPRRDFTMTLSPRAQLWLRAGRTWFTGLISEDVVWYQKYAAERSGNTTYTVAWKAPLNRVLLTTSAVWLSTRTRPGFEIDARARRREPQYTGGIEVRGFAKTFIGVRGSWGKVRFDETAEFNGSSLQDQLDRTNTAGSITLRHELTPLTSITFSAGRAEERFDVAASRDSISRNYSVALSFDPAALIRGTATMGFTSYEPQSADLPGYRGTTAAVNLTYTLLGSTRISGAIARDVQLSYDINQPYYLLTGGSGSIGQQIFGPLDLIVRGSSQHLKYQARTGVTLTAPDRTDRVTSYGGGLGIHLGDSLRLGFNIDKERRTSVLPDRQFVGLKYGSSLTYGL
jgi:hypothetical protein